MHLPSPCRRPWAPVRHGRLAAALRAWPQARSGQIAILFGLMILPILFAAGAAIDYSRRNAAKARLDAAVDAAVLAVISQKSNAVSADSLLRMDQQFKAEAARIPGVSVTSFLPLAPAVTGKTVSVSATYTATVKTTLGGLMNVPTMAIGGRSAGERKLAQYIDFYLLLDNSPSMGLAATNAEIARMIELTKSAPNHPSCAFACHERNADGTDKMDDHYHIAKNNNVILRINVLRDAVLAMVDRAKTSMSLAQQFRMETWTFSDIQTQISALTTSLDQTRSDAQKIDLAYNYSGTPANQTAYERAIKKMNETVPASGTGVTAASPIRFLFFVTDGVQDSPVDGSVSNQSAGSMVSANRFIGPIDPATCQALKDKGVRIGIIYTTYLELPGNWTYDKYVKPFEKQIASTLKACASSDDLFFPVSTNGDIVAAMLKLFDTAVASVRITN